MTKNLRTLLSVSIVTLLVLGTALPMVGAQDDAVTITWFVGLGTGSRPDQLDGQMAVVEAFNASRDDIELEIIIVDNDEAPQTLATLIATGESPDIIGPVGFSGTNQFLENLVDLQPFIDETGYDLGQFDTTIVDFNRLSEQGLVGLPFATFPSFLFYRPELFDEADLEYPPAAYGEPYILDGEERVWDVETLREVAMLLTVDENGFDATEDEFDPDGIIQWGFVNQWTNMRQIATVFGAESMVRANGDGTFSAVMTDNWRTAYNWTYDAIWEDHFYPNNAQNNSDLLGNDNPFGSGNVAMANSHLWFTGSLAGDTEWQAAALPSYEGEVTARLHADTFRLLNTSDNLPQAFEVMVYLTGEASLDLFQVYGGLPARTEDRAQFFATLDETFTQGVNWDVAQAGLQYVDIPSHEERLPNNNESFSRLQSFWSLLWSTPGLDVDAEIDLLLEDLTAIYNAAE